MPIKPISHMRNQSLGIPTNTQSSHHAPTNLNNSTGMQEETNHTISTTNLPTPTPIQEGNTPFLRDHTPNTHSHTISPTGDALFTTTHILNTSGKTQSLAPPANFNTLTHVQKDTATDNASRANHIPHTENHRQNLASSTGDTVPTNHALQKDSQNPTPPADKQISQHSQTSRLQEEHITTSNTFSLTSHNPNMHNQSLGIQTNTQSSHHAPASLNNSTGDKPHLHHATYPLPQTLASTRANKFP